MNTAAIIYADAGEFTVVFRKQRFSHLSKSHWSFVEAWQRLVRGGLVGGLPSVDKLYCGKLEKAKNGVIVPASLPFAVTY